MGIKALKELQGRGEAGGGGGEEEVTEGRTLGGSGLVTGGRLVIKERLIFGKLCQHHYIHRNLLTSAPPLIALLPLLCSPPFFMANGRL